MQEENHKVSSFRTDKPKLSGTTTRVIILALALLIVGAGSFYAGTLYAGTKNTSNAMTTGSAAANSGSGASDGFSGFRQLGVVGTVTAISTSSISVQDRRTGTTKTYAINSATVIMDGGTTATVSSINNGDIVRIRPSTSDSSLAAQILVNPIFRGQNNSANNSPLPGQTN